jgi:Zn-dependent metalloprotease
MVLFQRSRKPAVVLGLTGLAAAALAGFGASAAGAAPSAAPPPRPSQAQSKAFAVDSASSLVAGRPSALHASKDDKFTAQSVVSDPSGLQYVPYVRSYKGLPVVGGDFVVVTDAKGAVKSTSVAQTTAVPDLSMTAKVTAATAQKTANKQLKVVDSSTKPTLAVYALNGAPKLAWQSRVSGNSGKEPSSLSVYVDAQSGKVLGTQEHVMAGDGTAAYSGPSPVHLDTTHSGSTFSLKDPNTTNLSCQDAANNTTFSGPDDLWGNGNATSKETGCVDALYTAQTERHMLTDWLGRNGRRERVLRRHAGAGRSQHGRRLDRFAGRRGSRVGPRHRRPHPGRHLWLGNAGVRRRHVRCGQRVVQQPAGGVRPAGLPGR